MNRACSYGFGENDLGRRELEGQSGHAPHRGEPLVDLDDQMCEPARSLAPPDIADPFPEQRGVDQGVPPERFGHVRIVPDHCAQRIVRNKTQRAIPQRRDLMVEHVKVEALRSEEHTSELQSPEHLVCRLLLEKKKNDSAGIEEIEKENQEAQTEEREKTA